MLYDVVIAGAGPVGLFLSCELAHAGCSVLVLEQAGSADSPLKHLPFGLRGLNTPTLEALDRRGLLDAVAAAQVLKPDKGAPPPGTAHWLAQPRALGGHFAGIPFALDCVDSGCWNWRLPTPVGTQMAVELQALERVLAERASALGVRIERGRAVEAVQAGETQVVIETADGAVRGRWLVGCDGGRSTVRKQCGFSFVGTDPEFTGHSLLVELEDPSVLTPGRQYTAQGMCNFNPPGVLALADFDGGAGHRTHLDLDAAQALLRRVSGCDATITALHLHSTWTDGARQASVYRNGRVLLAGDAAHVHSPLGGQGLNLGIGDAMNLGWKLARVVRGDAGVALLESYQAERHPIGAKVLDWSRAQVALMRPGAGSRALAAVMADLAGTRDGATYLAERVWGVSQQLDLGNGHPLVGRSVPDFRLADGRRMGEVLRTGQGALLVFDENCASCDLVDRWRQPFTRIASAVDDTLGLGAVLVRPDGIVAWACDAGSDGAGLDQALQRWYGPLATG
ncbi:FAD-dependent oxidoreductase [Stenotrophomonas maltophilia]|uniref:FAD-dependent monooxygenase n=1 Tax=Stenotrophomonas maltophilia TaxID=40324 RepID=UPI0015DECF45|nr:FAD-dependent monooxygenase [Stenotrophomonas maltophilia]MBA0280765.1 FAD-dependent oxidoreductase [Stenotrophomonas maltophilia]MBA0344755.1 FAD-dependent oxidoreductase [Stenotrophomonas maltophilia]MBA0357857.1 FAD-dependent oxidoreductase [Stenotrophomonas maltophilia]MBA0519887.1 FAD-dependent oxidoreductase [Stenotrophomonas maltophilia]